jgi:hypothetical protein
MKLKVEFAGVRRLELQQAPCRQRAPTSVADMGGILVYCFDILCGAARNFN